MTGKVRILDSFQHHHHLPLLIPHALAHTFDL